MKFLNNSVILVSTESVSEQSPKLYRQVATEQGSRLKLCVLLFENGVIFEVDIYYEYSIVRI